MNPHELAHVNGQSVLVKSSMDRSDPPVALRGTLDARTDPAGRPEVKIVLEYPDMNNSAAQHGVITLDEADVARLLAEEHDGVYSFTINRPLTPGPEPRGVQAVS